MTDSHESAASWQRYAENHTGVAFRIACGDDSSVGDAMQVEYTENRPEITCITEQMEILMNQAKIVPQETFAEKFIMKSKMELKEKEWRFFKTMDHDPGGSEQEKHLWYDDALINAIEIRAVYFGVELIAPSKKRC